MKNDITVAICDNEKIELDITASMVRDWLTERNAGPDGVRVFTGAAELRSEIQSGAGYDVYILGVSMSGISGIELGRLIHSRSPHVPIIYITRSKSHALDAYSVNAIRYLIRPVKYDEIASALDFAAIVLAGIPKSRIEVKLMRTVTSVNADDVLYVENSVRSMRYYMADGSNVNGTHRNISFEAALEPLLSSGSFVQTHKSFVVNVRHIKEMRTASVLMSNGVAVPISRRHLSSVHSAYSAYVSGTE